MDSDYFTIYRRFTSAKMGVGGSPRALSSPHVIAPLSAFMLMLLCFIIKNIFYRHIKIFNLSVMCNLR